MRITSKQLRQIIREELGRMNESKRSDGRHGTDWDYGTYGDESQGGRDEGWDDEEVRPARSAKLSDAEIASSGRGASKGARVRGYSSFGFPSHEDRGTVVSRPDSHGRVDVEWDNGTTSPHFATWLPKA